MEGSEEDQTRRRAHEICAERIVWTEVEYAAQTRQVDSERVRHATALVLDCVVRHLAEQMVADHEEGG